MVALTTALAGSELAPASDDTTTMEIRYLEAALGAHLGGVLAFIGIDALRDRSDLERVAFALQGLGL